MVRHVLSVGAFLVSLCHPSYAASPAQLQDDATVFVEKFCKTFVYGMADYDPNASAIWPTDDPAVFAPFVTSGLAELLKQAIAHSDAYQQATDGKPPLGDGIPWDGSADAASECTAGPVTKSGSNYEVLVHYQYAEDPTDGFTDRLVLVRQGDELRIDDILYGNEEDAGGLRWALNGGLKEPVPE